MGITHGVRARRKPTSLAVLKPEYFSPICKSLSGAFQPRQVDTV